MGKGKGDDAKDRENSDTDKLIREHQRNEAPSYSQWVADQQADYANGGQDG